MQKIYFHVAQSINHVEFMREIVTITMNALELLNVERTIAWKPLNSILIAAMTHYNKNFKPKKFLCVFAVNYGNLIIQLCMCIK